MRRRALHGARGLKLFERDYVAKHDDVAPFTGRVD